MLPLLQASTGFKSKAKPASAAKADSKSSPRSKKKASAKEGVTKKVTASKKKSKSSPKPYRSSKQTKSQDATDESSLDTNLPDWISKYPELVKLAQRASDLLTPYVAPEFTTVSAQKYWEAFLPSPVPSDAEVKCTTVGIEAFCKFMDPNHHWRKAMDLWPEHACLFDTTDFQLDSHISQRADYPERLCGVWRRLRGYGNEKQAVISFAI
ncbi:LOW QUALITY PROTEIN: hypothetical protein PHMEG_00024818 [Phytophthora megakarya]|uniref:Uncharacterized protein n=1 Tax=Phytophthora megakarya TaxID=4795 RepID=A0A225VDI4_9STRA|nr:LOW QUALITY PROTEIN: hypothetical protein PHMEG_00024818 [Phytophthora megakarya]